MIQISSNPEIIDEIGKKFLYRVRNVPLPKTFTKISRFTTRPKYIIIHDTNCLSHADSTLNVDSPDTAIGSLKIKNIAQDSLKDINYHYVVDKIGNDYEILIGRPMNSLCDHKETIEPQYEFSIHVIYLTDLNVEVPETRFYQILAYKCLAPLIRMLKIGGDPKNVIRFHDEVKTKSFGETKCPGDFLARELLIAQTRRFL